MLKNQMFETYDTTFPFQFQSIENLHGFDVKLSDIAIPDSRETSCRPLGPFIETFSNGFG